LPSPDRRSAREAAECFSLDRLALLAEQVGLNVRIRATRPYGGGGNSD